MLCIKRGSGDTVSPSAITQHDHPLIPLPHHTLIKQTKPLPIKTANGPNTTNQKVPMTLTTPAERMHSIQPYILPQLTENLLSGMYYINQNGPVMFTADGAYLLLMTFLRFLNMKNIARMHDDLYLVHTRT